MPTCVRGTSNERGARSKKRGALWNDKKQRSGILWTGSTLCLLDLRRGRWNAARSCYEELILTADGAGDRWLVAKLEASLGGVYANLGEPDLAIGSYRRALDLARKLDKGEDEATVLNNLGALHRALGEPEEAIALYQQALKYFRGQGNAYWQARTLNNLGYAHLTLGDLERSRTFFEEALSWRRRAKDRRGEATTLRNLGRVAQGQGRLAAAETAFVEALDLARDLGDRRGEATGLRLLGTAFQKQGQVANAREQFDRALALRRALGDRSGIAAVLLARGQALLPDDAADAAEHDLGEALALYQEIRDPVGQFEALVDLARTARHGGDLPSARRRSEEAITLLETLRIRIADPSRQASFLAARHGVFETLIEILMALHRANPAAGYGENAFEVSERARARTLLDLLEEPAVRDDHAIAPDLRVRWRTARRSLAAKAQRQFQILGRGGEGAAAESVAEAVALEVRDALTEIETVQAEIRRASPRFAALSAPRTLDAGEVQRLLDSDTVLLEVALGAERSFSLVGDLKHGDKFRIARTGGHRGPGTAVSPGTHPARPPHSPHSPRGVTGTRQVAVRADGRAPGNSADNLFRSPAGRGGGRRCPALRALRAFAPSGNGRRASGRPLRSGPLGVRFFPGAPTSVARQQAQGLTHRRSLGRSGIPRPGSASCSGAVYHGG